MTVLPAPPLQNDESTIGVTLRAMNPDDPRELALFLEVYGTLPRAGPGGTADTLRALAMVPNSEDIRSVLDLGCGPGAQTLVLAEALSDAGIVAMDLIPQMVDEARRRVARAGRSHRVRVEVGDMMATGLADNSQDLIWCEGAIYFAGVRKALEMWRPLLVRNGVVAFTEPVWIRPSPPEELTRWWRREYPALTDEGGVRAAIDGAGYETVGSFTLPADSWWDEYYRPMEERLPEFTSDHPDDPVAASIAAEAEDEIRMFRQYSDFYSYGFFVVHPVSVG